MPARNGRQYLDGLRAQDRAIYLGGERVRDVTTHPGLASGARAVAALETTCSTSPAASASASALRAPWG